MTVMAFLCCLRLVFERTCYIALIFISLSFEAVLLLSISHALPCNTRAASETIFEGSMEAAFPPGLSRPDFRIVCIAYTMVWAYILEPRRRLLQDVPAYIVRRV